MSGGGLRPTGWERWPPRKRSAYRKRWQERRADRQSGLFRCRALTQPQAAFRRCRCGKRTGLRQHGAAGSARNGGIPGYAAPSRLPGKRAAGHGRHPATHAARHRRNGRRKMGINHTHGMVAPPHRRRRQNCPACQKNSEEAGKRKLQTPQVCHAALIIPRAVADVFQTAHALYSGFAWRVFRLCLAARRLCCCISGAYRRRTVLFRRWHAV